MILNAKEYRDKVLGCWMGKNIGGTLGAPFEWKRQINNITFYTQDLGGDPLPNDDLDIQLLWLVAMEEKGIDVDAHLLAEYWRLYVTPHWAEYGTAKINMKSGLMPPLCGTVNNEYKHSCGSFIRSEIWACIAPGFPKIAAKYAYEDGIIDHGNGEGVYGEVFCAALESAAFVEKDIKKLIDIGLSYIPDDCGVAQAVRSVVESYESGKTWIEARDEIISKYAGWMARQLISERDMEKGFVGTKRGWDVPSNVAIVVIGMLYGEGDFDKSMCIAVNCGEDTDCTGATVGAIFGIMHGIDAIPEKWIEPIGRKIRTACLNLGELGYYGDQLPADIDNLTERVYRIAQQVILRYNLPIRLCEDMETDLDGLEDSHLFAGEMREILYRSPNGPVFSFPFFDIWVDYGDTPYVQDGTPKKIKITIKNKYKVQENVNIRWYAPDNWRISPSTEGSVYVPQAYFEDSLKEVEFQLETDTVPNNINRFVVEFTIDGRPTVMLVPIILLNGNLYQSL